MPRRLGLYRSRSLRRIAERIRRATSLSGRPRPARPAFSVELAGAVSTGGVAFAGREAAALATGTLRTTG
jgi:hypothetical protein